MDHGPESVVGRNIRRLRLLNGASQEALAFEVGIAARHLGRIEGGKISATIGVIGRIADALDCSITDLLEVIDAPMPPNLPRGKGVQEGAVPVLSLQEEGVAYDTEASDHAANGRAAIHETLDRILRTGISGPCLAEAEELISSIVADAGGEKKLSAAQRRRIDLARAWALARDVNTESNR